MIGQDNDNVQDFYYSKADSKLQWQKDATQTVFAKTATKNGVFWDFVLNRKMTKADDKDGQEIKCGDTYSWKWYASKTSKEVNSAGADEGELLITIDQACALTSKKIVFSVGAYNLALSAASVLAASLYLY